VREEALKTKKEKVVGTTLFLTVMHSTVSTVECRISGTHFFGRDSSFYIPECRTDFLFLAQVTM
jgi:hypothetical protein